MLQEQDAELRVMATEEVARLEPQIARLEQELKLLLLPKDPNHERTSSSKSARVPEATKPLCSRPRSSACTHATPKVSVGALTYVVERVRRRAA